MLRGARVTDAVEYFRRQGQARDAIRVVRDRPPEKLRWRKAVATVTSMAAPLRGRERMRVEEPVRELILDLYDRDLRLEVVLDARRQGVDLDRGDVLPERTMADLRRFAFLAGTDLGHVHRYLPLPGDFATRIDTAAVAIVTRALADAHKRRAQKLWLQIPDDDGPEPIRLHHQIMAERASYDADLSKRWTALGKALIAGAR